jgi:hypothetical protein
MAAPPIPIPGSDTHSTIITAHPQEQDHPVPNRANPEHSLCHDIKDRSLGKTQDASPYSASNCLVPTGSDGVDVQRAEQDFAQLNRQLSAYSERSRCLSRQQSKQYAQALQTDVEKAVSLEDSLEEPWDLETTLRGAKAADHEAGIKAKRIGSFHTPLLAAHCVDRLRCHMGQPNRPRNRRSEEDCQDLSRCLY